MVFATERHTTAAKLQKYSGGSKYSEHKVSRGRGQVGMGRGRERGLNEETHGRRQCEVLYICGEMGDGIRTLCSSELGGYLVRRA